MTFKSNISDLKSYIFNAPEANKKRIKKLIALYEEKKIVNIKTALNAVQLLASTNKTTIKSGKAIKVYESLVEKYEDARPMTGRLTGYTDTKTEHHYYLKVILYTSSDTTSQRDERKEQERARNKKYKYSKGLRQIYIGGVQVILKYPLTKNIVEFLLTHHRSLLTIDKKALEALGREESEENTDDFRRMVSILKTNSELKKMFNEYGESYITGIYLIDYNSLNIKKVKPANPATSRKRASENISCYNAYITTQLDLGKDYIYQAIERGHYKKNQCWINTLLDVYGDGLLSQNKQQRYVITVDKILEIIGMANYNIEQGFTIQDFEPFFKKFRIPVRVYDAFKKMIYKYDPEIRNPHIPVLYCLAKDDHIYTLNHNTNSLIQRNNHIDEEEESEYKLTASTHYYINEDAELIYCRLIDNVEDILNIVKEEVKEDKSHEGKKIHLVVSNDRIDDIFFELKEVGYTPLIKFECGRITMITLEFNSLIFVIKSQQLVTSSIERCEAVESETVYNNMNRAMHDFHGAVFVNKTKSYYNQQDIEILDEYRTVANIGMLKQLEVNQKTNEPIHKMIEIDRSRAYTTAFGEITKVPVFNVFDIFKPYNNEEISDYTLYTVQSKSANLFFNKDNNLCYGYILRKLVVEKNSGKSDLDFEIVAYKEPSELVKVNYKQHINDLYNCYNKISEDEDEDMRIKKLIANINIGLLEKSQNTKSHSNVFNTIEEARHYQLKYGGNIHIIEQNEFKANGYIYASDDEEWGLLPKYSGAGSYHHIPYYEIDDGQYVKHASILDRGINDDDDDVQYDPNLDFDDDGIDDKGFRYRVVHYEDYKKPPAKAKLKYYVLTISDTQAMLNGFRYIKEMILQNHNYFMYKSYQKLQEKNVQVYSVKTDAFTIKSSDYHQAWSVLQFDEGFGTWRVSKKSNIIYPTNKWFKQDNKQIEIQPIVINHLETPDEYDNQYICKLLIDNRRVLIKASVPGAGKSYSCKYLEKLGYNVCMVAPSNELVKDILNDGIISVTVHRFFGCGITEESRSKPFDDSKFDVIVFDEIYLNDLHFLAKIYRYINNHPEKIILATGDTFQNDPIMPLSSRFEHEEYADHIMSILFPNQMFFTKNKRLNNDEDRAKLVQLKEDIFSGDQDVLQVLKKYFRFTSEIETLNNISFRNNIAEEVSVSVRKKLKKKSEYEVGEFLLCKKFRSVKAYKILKDDEVKSVGKYNINNNCKYEIIDNNGKTLVLKDTQYDYLRKDQIDENDQITVIADKGEYVMISYAIYFDLPLDIVKTHFIYSYCRTGHSLQGVTIKDKITIFDWRFQQNQDQLKLRKWIYVAVTRATSLDNVLIFKGGNVEFNKQLLQIYLKKKVQGYKEQDKKAGREIDNENYITPEWLENNLDNCCYFCRDTFETTFKGCNVSSSLTADRIDNELPHEIDNIRPCCNSCNIRKLKVV